MTVKILISPSGFKESLKPQAAADCIETGILGIVPDATIVKAPLVDGGELRHLTATGPIGEPVETHYGFLGGDEPKTAVLEMAASAGLDEGTERIPVGCGDSGTFDGGVGIAQALGARFLDSSGDELTRVGLSSAMLRRDTAV